MLLAFFGMRILINRPVLQNFTNFPINPTKHQMSIGQADHVYIASVGPRPIFDLYATCNLGLLFGHLTMTPPGRQYNVQYLNAGIGNFLDVMWTSKTGAGNWHDLGLQRYLQMRSFLRHVWKSDFGSLKVQTVTPCGRLRQVVEIDMIYPTKHWTSDRRADHVYIGSVGPWPILDIYSKSKLGPLFGRPTMTQLGRHIDVQHLTFELGNFFGRHLDVYDRCRKFTWLYIIFFYLQISTLLLSTWLIHMNTDY